VTELTGESIRKATPWLKWRAQLRLPGEIHLLLGCFATADDAARAYDAEVRRRGWAHVRALNFPQPEEQAAYPQAEEQQRCDERGLLLSLAPEPHVATQSAGAVQATARLQKRGKSGFFGVVKNNCKNKGTKWLVQMCVTGSAQNQYIVG
jgi:hypothetical protein